MYEYLEGKVAARTATRLVLDVGGIGFDLFVPLGAPFPERGVKGRVHTHLVVRDDAHVLYGFSSADDRELFRLLLRVRGVGPTMALAILSGVQRDELVRAVLEEDARPLTRIKGVGKKTADQVLLDLRDKAKELERLGVEFRADGAAVPARPPDPSETNVQDAIAALVSIGYTDKDAKKQVERARESVGAADIEALVRAAIQG